MRWLIIFERRDFTGDTDTIDAFIADAAFFIDRAIFCTDGTGPVLTALPFGTVGMFVTTFPPFDTSPIDAGCFSRTLIGGGAGEAGWNTVSRFTIGTERAIAMLIASTAGRDAGFIQADRSRLAFLRSGAGIEAGGALS